MKIHHSIFISIIISTRIESSAVRVEYNNAARIQITKDDSNIKTNSKRAVDGSEGYKPRITHANRTNKDRYMEIYLVLDNSMYHKYGSTLSAVNRGIELVNKAGALFLEIGIRLALLEVEVWNVSNPIHYNESSSISDILEVFRHYRRFNISPRAQNDIALLITAVTNRQGSISAGGKKICTQTDSLGVLVEVTGRDLPTALAHLIGHNMGLQHDSGSNCVCPSGATCVMQAGSNIGKGLFLKHFLFCTESMAFTNLSSVAIATIGVKEKVL